MIRTEPQPASELPVKLDASFGELHFGQARLGDQRRTKRLIKVANALIKHPGGSLPEKLSEPGELDGLYHLMQADTVTHKSVLAPHLERTMQRISDQPGPVLILHDTTELDYTTHESVRDAGQIGNGSRRGWLCHNSLAVAVQEQEVLGLTSQILHRRAQVKTDETTEQRRKRKNRESRLWLQGTETLPTGRNLVDVCDRGADTFEFLEHELKSGRTFVIRSAYNRGALPGHQSSTNRGLLHDIARALPALGQWTLSVPAARLVVKPKKTGKKKVVQRKRREAVLHVAAAPVEICLPLEKNGEYGTERLPLWIVRVWEPNPPAGVKPLEWLLLTNHPVVCFEEAYQVAGWYESRWIIEEYHKAQKTGCSIERPQFTSSDRLHPMIALLSVVAISLLNLRELSRRKDAQARPATDVISIDYVNLLSAWRLKKRKPDWTIHEFFMALARLGGHLNRKRDHPPGWIVLWRGWTKLQLMMDGARALERSKNCA